MNKLKSETIKYSKKLNSTNLSALRSGNISVRVKEKKIDGFYITPSGAKYSSLKSKDIVFVSLKGKFDKKKESHHQNGDFTKIFMLIKKMQKQLSMLTLRVLRLFQRIKNLYLHFII